MTTDIKPENECDCGAGSFVDGSPTRCICACRRNPMTSSPTNQCMGCQANWPTKPASYGRTMLHDVIGGYPHEVVGCTADRYRDVAEHDAGDEDRKP